MNYIVAVSGGVDSVVLLDMLARRTITPLGKHSATSWSARESGAPRPESRDTPAQIVNATEHLPNEAHGSGGLIVAHVDHGIRSESSADARFVAALARHYGLPFQQTTLHLGESASEEQAREARYDFLYKLAREHKAVIATAHHQDDIVGSIAINLRRGTGWRGLAVLNRTGITRPLLGMTKSQLCSYAMKHQLEWVEDETNHNPKYLRNRLRAGVIGLTPDTTRRIVQLRQRQIQLVHDIDREVARIAMQFGGNRHAYTMIEPAVARELLRYYIDAQTGYRPTIEQAERVLLAIKTARPHTTVNVARDVIVRFSVREFVVDTSEKW